MPTDEKIQDIALRYILKHAANYPKSATIIGELHPLIAAHFSLAEGELVLVSAFFSDSSWYAFTTRRVTSQFQGVLGSIDPSKGVADDFPNFKGFKLGNSASAGAVPREIATVGALNSDAFIQFEYETWKAAMAPIYAVRYWNIKHPVLNKLMTTSERESYKHQK